MAIDTRVCPHCGEPPGQGVFCEACGRNLSAVERLPTRADWEAQRTKDNPAPLAERCATALASFLTSMRAAGDPGRTSLPAAQRRAFGRQPKIEGWLVRPVVRRDEENPTQYEPGLLLTVDGAFHRIDSEVRGWGQRDFPQFYDSVSTERIEPPVDEQLIGELAALLRAHELTTGGAAQPPDG
jgi:hypothetical protein